MSKDAVLHKQTFLPGQEWCFFKLYAGYKTSEGLLLTKIHPFFQQLLAEGKIDKWFFIRYKDPEFHLRLRFHLKSQEDLEGILDRFYQVLQPYIDEKVIWRFQMDTYEPELGRYGVKAMEESESIFFYDSQMILAILAVMKANGLHENYRWLASLKAIDSLLDGFLGQDLVNKQKIIANFKNQGTNEYYTQSKINQKLSKRYRKHEAMIAELFENPLANKDRQNHLFLQPIQEKAVLLQPAIQKLKWRYQQREIKIPIMSLIGSHIHMMVNRFFRTQAVLCEYVLYYYLDRYYTTQLKRNRS